MTTVVLVIHLLLAIGLVGVILIQRSEGGMGSMGGGSGGGGMGGFMSGRQAANLLTRTTGFLAAGFFATSLLLAIMASGNSEKKSILDQPAPAQSQEQPAPAAPEAPAQPSAPVAD